MDLKSHLQKLAAPGEVQLDSDQELALHALEALGTHALATAPRASWLDRFRNPGVPPKNGLYLWGGVGRGKTLLLDTFAAALPTKQKQRVHLHHLLRDVHQELRRIGHQAQPLDVIAERISKNTRVLCIDEFHVDDIADAMLLAGLLHALIERGVTLVTTSNVHPQDLYKNGLHRDRFTPAIALIEQRMQVLELSGTHDYRMQLAADPERYQVRSESQATADLDTLFTRISGELGQRNHTLTISHRPLLARACTDDCVWFDFSELCATPRSASDYIEIARRFRNLVISNIAPMSDVNADVAQRFIQLIDAIYDHRVHTWMTALAEPGDLYSGRSLEFPFRRTRSRVQEMRSAQYAATPHRVK